jgi:hypothetical protein
VLLYDAFIFASWDEVRRVRPSWVWGETAAVVSLCAVPTPDGSQVAVSWCNCGINVTPCVLGGQDGSSSIPDDLLQEAVKRKRYLQVTSIQTASVPTTCRKLCCANLDARDSCSKASRAQCNLLD